MIIASLWFAVKQLRIFIPLCAIIYIPFTFFSIIAQQQTAHGDSDDYITIHFSLQAANGYPDDAKENIDAMEQYLRTRYSVFPTI